MTARQFDDDLGPEPKNAEILLAAHGVNVIYPTKKGPIHALKDLDLTVDVGEFVSVLGPSGCGKSTLLKIAAGLLPLTSGSINLNGTPITKPRPDVGVVFQKPNLLPWSTVLGNALVAAESLGLDRTASRARALELLELVGLENFADNLPNELSGGMQQRVGLVRGLVHDPSVLLMDEPFAALDAMTREHMTMELQRLWMSTGKSVVFITHSIPEAVFLSDRVIVMSPRPGTLVEELDIDLDRPRSMDTMSSPRFGEYCAHLRRHFTNVIALD